MRRTENIITELKTNQVFVFGSNSDGNHYGGAAKIAVEKFGAIMGQGHGLQGMSYAINTMSGINVIKKEIAIFIHFAITNPSLTFIVTELGCGIAGYTPEQIAPLFLDAVSIENIHLPDKFWKIIK